jgi:hypothetical protein
MSFPLAWVEINHFDGIETRYRHRNANTGSIEKAILPLQKLENDGTLSVEVSKSHKY